MLLKRAGSLEQDANSMPARPSPKPRTRLHTHAAQEFLARHGRPAGPLHRHEPQRAGTGGDDRPRFEERARRTAPLGETRAKDLDALLAFAEIGLEKGPRIRRKGAHEIVQRGGRKPPIDTCFLVL